jgi:hypothetical protein
MPNSPNSAGANIGPAGPPALFGDLFDVGDIIDIFEGPGKKLSKAAQDLESFLVEQGGHKSSLDVLAPLGKANKVIRFVILGGKLVNVIFGDDDQSAANSYLVPLDEFADFVNPIPIREFQEYVTRLQSLGTEAGWLIMDPVWLGDP